MFLNRCWLPWFVVAVGIVAGVFVLVAAVVALAFCCGSPSGCGRCIVVGVFVRVVVVAVAAVVFGGAGGGWSGGW